MARRRPVDPAFRAALRRLARRELSYAEAWRRLARTAARLDQPRPSYASVRLIYAAERRAHDLRKARREQRAAEALAGLVPRS